MGLVRILNESLLNPNRISSEPDRIPFESDRILIGFRPIPIVSCGIGSKADRIELEF